MQIQKINNQQNQNFKAGINAPAEFWKAVKNRVPEKIAKDTLSRISGKPGFELHIIDIDRAEAIKVREGVCNAKITYTAKLGSEKIAEKTSNQTWANFLTEIADKFAPLKQVDELIKEVQA